MKTIYLNKTGSRWVNVGETITFKATMNGELVTRKVCFWEQIGNFAVPTVRHEGKKVMLMDDGNGVWMINDEENRKAKYLGFFARKSLTS
jgi:hypothetical protein